MPLRPLRALAAAGLAVLLLAAGCGGAAATGGAGETLHITLPGNPTDLNSMTTADEISYDVLNQVLEGLTRANAQGAPQPAIASSWTVGPGGHTYTFHLRRATWSNGAPVTASDFVYAWRQALDPRHGSQESYMLQYIRGAGALLGLKLPSQQKHPAAYRAAVARIAPLQASLGVSAPNPRTLVVTLASPTPFWLALTSLPVYFPAPQAQIAQWGFAQYGTDPAHLLSDGPFVLSAWQPNASLTLRRNVRYWDASAVALQVVQAEIVTDAATVANLYQAGSIQAILPSIAPAQLPEFQGQPGFSSRAQAAVEYVQFQLHTPGLGQVDVRRALSLALDRAALAGLAGAGSRPATSLTPPVVDAPPGTPFASQVGAALPTQAQPAQARADLAAGLRAAGLRQLPTLTLLAPPGTAGLDEAQALQAAWKSVLGIRVQIDSPDNATYVSDIESGHFEMALLGWNADYDDPTTFLDIFRSGSANNFGGWSDPAFDSALRAAGGASGAARAQHLVAAERELLSQLPVIPLWWPAIATIVRPGVRGLVLLPTGPDYYLGGVRVTQG